MSLFLGLIMVEMAVRGVTTSWTVLVRKYVLYSGWLSVSRETKSQGPGAEAVGGGSLSSLKQWFPNVLMLLPSNTVPRVVVTPNH